MDKLELAKRVLKEKREAISYEINEKIKYENEIESKLKALTKAAKVAMIKKKRIHKKYMSF